MDTDKTDVTVVGRGVLNAFWFGLIVFIAALVINEVSAHNNSGGWSTLSRGLSMAFIIFGAGVYCLFFSVIALSELVSNRKNGNVDTTRVMIALTFHGIVALIVTCLTFSVFCT
ncbi:hypothetical protein [Morganella sp. GD04133]|uniref:hypothetical protein n=1 Tax=Morganella sp. GD04133 TaxID=2975435 RepID=UPI0024469C9C|nr:hypothetical protein [Morganella sp. GD04133]MDH0353373.1 hypothetical protein [Morganella sp. GD04133]